MVIHHYYFFICVSSVYFPGNNVKPYNMLSHLENNSNLAKQTAVAIAGQRAILLTNSSSCTNSLYSFLFLTKY